MRLTPEQQDEIAGQRGETRPTRRATVPTLEEVLYQPLPVLDHGFVRVVDYMGDDAAVVQAARVSYGRGTRKISEDHGLINYLMRHRHTTPFEMCEIKYHVKLPIFVARQWIRHRTANVNEYSARYSILDNEFYVPAPEHLAAQAKTNRQGREHVLDSSEARHVLDLLRAEAERAYAGYAELLNEDGQGAGDAGHAGAMGADDLRGLSRIPDERVADFRDRPRRHPPDDRRRTRRSSLERPLAKGVARADGVASRPGGFPSALNAGDKFAAPSRKVDAPGDLAGRALPCSPAVFARNLQAGLLRLGDDRLAVARPANLVLRCIQVIQPSSLVVVAL